MAHQPSEVLPPCAPPPGVSIRSRSPSLA
jgi:hypothetical protein